MSERPRILVSNDDGYQSEGLRALVAAMEELGEVWVVAPEVEQSASSHAISIHRPLRLREVRPRWYAVDGTPTDCSWLGIHHVLKGRRPVIMVSGINHGPNLSDDVTYSGTVAAAMEAVLFGVPGIAISLDGYGGWDFACAAGFARRFVGAVGRHGLPPGVLLNVNVPNVPAGEIRGVVPTRLGQRVYRDELVLVERDAEQRTYRLAGPPPTGEPLPGTDVTALAEGYISITPLHLDLTAHRFLAEMQGWELPGALDGGIDCSPPAC